MSGGLTVQALVRRVDFFTLKLLLGAKCGAASKS
jgi:hypothetical protein